MQYNEKSQQSNNSQTGLIKGGVLVAGVEVTIITSENHTLSATATQQPLESGAIVSDHIVINPETVSVSYEIQNAGRGMDQSRDVFEIFKTMLEAREKIELITDFYLYTDMVIVSITPLSQAPFKGRLQSTITLQKVNSLELKTGRSEKRMSGSTSKTGAAQQKAGEQQPKEVNQSYLSKLAEKNK